MGPNTILKLKISKYSLKVKLKIFQHTIFIKFGRPLAIIVHYTVQFNVECCKSFVPDMGPNTIFLIKKYISNDTLKLQLKIPNIQSLYLIKFGGTLAIIVNYTVQFNLECCKSSVPDMRPNTTFKIKKYIYQMTS